MEGVRCQVPGFRASEADGMRVRKTPSGGTATDFMLDGREIAEEITGSSVTSYVGRRLISQISGSTRTIYHADGIGSTRAMSGDSAVVGESAVYDAYGNLLSSSGAVPSFGYAGVYRYYTDGTGLDYLKARYYDPGVGRFASRDRLGYRGGLNLYGYVHNNPVVTVDPSGNFAWWVACVIPCGACVGIPLAAILGCLAGGCAETGTCGQCFKEIMCQEWGKDLGFCAACAVCLIGRYPPIQQPKPPMPYDPPTPPWGDHPPWEF